MRVRRLSQIDWLYRRGLLTPREYLALQVYRRHATSMHRSSGVSNPALMRGQMSARDGVQDAAADARRIVERCERACGELADVLRAVVGEDQALRHVVRRRGRERASDQMKVVAERVALELNAFERFAPAAA